MQCTLYLFSFFLGPKGQMGEPGLANIERPPPGTKGDKGERGFDGPQGNIGVPGRNGKKWQDFLPLFYLFTFCFGGRGEGSSFDRVPGRARKLFEYILLISITETARIF